MNTKPLPPLAELDQAASHLARAVRSARVAEATSQPGLPPERAKLAPYYAGDAANAIGNALGILERMGATVTHLPTPPEIPLEHLDTPETRALRNGLRELLPVAEVLDAKRGRTLPPSVDALPGDSRGTDLADEIASLVARLELEISGPAGRE